MTSNLTYGMMVFEWHHTNVLTHSELKNYTAEFLQRFVVVVSLFCCPTSPERYTEKKLKCSLLETAIIVTVK